MPRVEGVVWMVLGYLVGYGCWLYLGEYGNTDKKTTIYHRHFELSWILV